MFRNAGEGANERLPSGVEVCRDDDVGVINNSEAVRAPPSYVIPNPGGKVKVVGKTYSLHLCPPLSLCRLPYGTKYVVRHV